jgi:hypothetical protein
LPDLYGDPLIKVVIKGASHEGRGFLPVVVADAHVGIHDVFLLLEEFNDLWDLYVFVVIARLPGHGDGLIIIVVILSCFIPEGCLVLKCEIDSKNARINIFCIGVAMNEIMRLQVLYGEGEEELVGGQHILGRILAVEGG